MSLWENIKKRIEKFTERKKITKQQQENLPIDLSCIQGKYFAISGKLKTLTRQQAIKLLASNQCNYSPEVNSKISFLVIQSLQYHTSALDKAIKSVEQGQDIKIINEQEFKRMMGIIK